MMSIAITMSLEIARVKKPTMKTLTAKRGTAY